MRSLVLLLAMLAAGCAGNVADYIGPRASIVSPQLLRFGFDLAEARCVGEALGEAASPLHLRRLVRAATPVRRGALDPTRLAPSDFLLVAGSMGNADVRRAAEAAMRGCGMSAERITGIVAVPLAPDAPALPTALRPAWLNLGAAGSGQSISVDASTVEQDASTRTAWFRLADPGAQPGDNAYLLRIDCAARTIDARARQRRDAAGVVSERVDYPDNPLPVEGGTVMEIAFLAMCT